jgi:ribosomal protein S12 methylthiotransferase
MTETPKTTKVGLISLGCAKNLVDSEVMLGHLGRAGCDFVQDPAEADVILVNTCGFIEAAREESVETIIEAAQLKKNGRLKRLVVAGCMVQRYADDLKNSLPEVDAFIGLDQLDQVVESAGVEVREATPTSDLPLLVPGKRAAGPTATAAWGGSTYLYDEHTPRRLATPAWTAYLKIAEGCDHTCSFCAIPSFRGSFRSRDLDSIRAEATALSQRGVREVSLIAQDSSHYGRDIGLKEGVASLLEGLNEIETLRWIRLHYLYPNTITQKLIDTMAALPRVVDYVDLPLQHAHPEMLKRMRRGGSAESHKKLLDRFRAAMPEGALRSTFIVGFPGETDDEFQALLDFVADVRFDHLGVFTYSHEESTPAHDRVDDVPEELKQERRERLMELQHGIAAEANRQRVGRTVEVLVEGAHPETEHLLVGRTRGQALDVDGQVLINDGQAAPGSFVQVELTEVAGYDLVGHVVGV